MPMIREKLERVTAGDVRSQILAQHVVRKLEEMGPRRRSTASGSGPYADSGLARAAV
jgi:hypothetical protein